MIGTPSPLRYPGGKTILYDRVKKIIKDNCKNKVTYIEPFSGGAGLALKLLLNNDVDKIIINDYDYAIYCFWYIVLYKTEKFCEDIKNVKVDLNEWEKQRYIYNNQNDYSIYEIGFATFFLNRTNRSGIIKGGPIGGKNQDGKYKIDCRFNREVLIDKIRVIAKNKSKIKLFNYDVNKFISNVIVKQKKETFIYFDPPYIQKGPELYKNHFQNEGHYLLANNIDNKLNAYKWIITYDDNPLVNILYKNYDKKNFNLTYYAGKNKLGNEVMIFSNEMEKKEI